MDAEYLWAPGGFAWWYVDLITPEGDGLVLIFAYGLPFLPGYAQAARRGEPQLPLERPSVNVALYERGRESFYVLQEYDSPQLPAGRHPLAPAPGGGSGGRAQPQSRQQTLSRNGARLRRPDASERDSRPGERGEGPGEWQQIGRSRFESCVRDGRRIVEATLDCAVPGTAERLTGTVRVEGVARRPDGRRSPGGAPPPHLWTPLTGPAEGKVSLDLGGTPLARLSGRAYHDRNGGRLPLHAQGIRRWMWGRFPLEDRELIYYLNWPARAGDPPRLLGLTIDAEGITRDAGALTVKLGPERRGRFGLRWPETIGLLREGKPWALIRPLAVVDDGPFYLRFQCELTTVEGTRVRGWSELCEPDRVDLARHRPLVRMRVHHASGRNSIWLPLFAGRRRGRVGRWTRSLVSRGSR